MFLSKENTIEDMVKLTYQLAQQQHLIQLKDAAEDETFNSEGEETKMLQLGEKKIEFVL